MFIHQESTGHSNLLTPAANLCSNLFAASGCHTDEYSIAHAMRRDRQPVKMRREGIVDGYP